VELRAIQIGSWLVYTEDTRWRNRSEFPAGRAEVRAFLQRKWARELDYRLIKELCRVPDRASRCGVAYEWHDDSNNWFRSYGNENWSFNDAGFMMRRFASINDLADQGRTASVSLAARKAAG